MTRGGTFEDRFLRELTRLSAGEDVAITNRALREALGWKDERFNSTREGLLSKGVVKAAPGQGGKTKFSTPVPKSTAGVVAKKALKLFISYSHSDERLKNALMAHLKPLERLGQIESWSDRSIKPGDNIDASIKEQLESADLVLFLISVDFINSNYCYGIELQNALERHQQEKVRIVPIILRDCIWLHSPLGGILALPKDGKAVTSWGNEDAALAHIAEEIHKLATVLLTST